METEVFDAYSVSLSESSELHVHEFLKQFGQVFPTKYSRESGMTKADASDRLSVSHLNFKTLHKLGDVRLEFVDELSLHLEFDERTRVLKIFRYPSVCRLFCSGTAKHGNFLTS